MKHVFVIHSNITFLSALATIAKENIDSKDVLITTRMKIAENTPIPSYFLPFDLEIRHFWKAMWMFKPYSYVDKFLKKHIGGEKFVAYVEAMTIPAKLIVSNPNCVEFHFIEEGDSAYYNFLPKHLATYDFLSRHNDPLRPNSIKRRYIDFLMILGGIGLKNLSLPFMPQCYFHFEGIRFYGFGSESFKQAENRVQLTWEELVNRFHFDQKYNLDNSSIWVGTSIGNGFNETALKDYLDGINIRCIPHLKNRGVSKVYIKHHPLTQNSPEVRNAEINVFKKEGIDVEVVSDETCLEIELLGKKNVNIYMLVSSIATYADQMGHHNIYTIAKHFPGYIEKTNLKVRSILKCL